MLRLLLFLQLLAVVTACSSLSVNGTISDVYHDYDRANLILKSTAPFTVVHNDLLICSNRTCCTLTYYPDDSLTITALEARVEVCATAWYWSLEVTFVATLMLIGLVGFIGGSMCYYHHRRQQLTRYRMMTDL